MQRRNLIIVVVIISAAAFGAGYLISPGSKGDGGGGNGEREVLYYVDPMNPSFRSPEPGTAPCGMALEPVYADGGGGEATAKGRDQRPRRPPAAHRGDHRNGGQRQGSARTPTTRHRRGRRDPALRHQLDHRGLGPRNHQRDHRVLRPQVRGPRQILQPGRLQPAAEFHLRSQQHGSQRPDRPTRTRPGNAVSRRTSSTQPNRCSTWE